MSFLEILLSNLLTPAVLFFLLGVTAALLHSDLKFPDTLYVGMTIYLLVAVGLKGGVALSQASLGAVWPSVLLAIAMGVIIPFMLYPVLRFVGKFSAVDSAAIAAHYGSVSAVTFTAGLNFLKSQGVNYEEYAPAFLAVMESPAIIVGIVIGRLSMPVPEGKPKPALWPALRTVLHEAMTGRGVILLVGALIIGLLIGENGKKLLAGFFVEPFMGVLALFLLELGLVTGRRLGDLRKVGVFLILFGTIAPVLLGLMGATAGHLAGLSVGGSTLFAILAASASYIAAPAAIRISLPEANPTLSLTSVLAITFPFNLTFGIPLYLAVARWMGGV